MFEDFFTSASATGPSFTTLFTGLAAINHKYYLTPYKWPNAMQLDDNIPTLPEILQQNGYTTVALDNLVNFRSHPKHFVRGFEFYINPSRFPKYDGDQTASEVNHRLIPWIKEHRKEKFFLFVHYWDPHSAYNQPAEYRKVFTHKKGDLSDLKVLKAPADYAYVPGWGKVDEIYEGDEELSIDLYDGEIRYVDDAVGGVIGAMDDVKVLDETVVIITSDHGEGLGQHGVYGHAGLHDSIIRVPLIISNPRLFPKRKRVKGFAQTADITATILGLAGASMPERIDGKDLKAVIDGELIHEEIFVETGGQRAIRTSKWKLIETLVKKWNGPTDPREVKPIEGGKRLELYDVERDPMEVINLVEKEKDVTLELSDRLDRWIRYNLGNGVEPFFSLGIPAEILTENML